MAENSTKAHWQSEKTHCPAGHEYTPENTRLKPQSQGRPGVSRECRECLRLYVRPALISLVSLIKMARAYIGGDRKDFRDPALLEVFDAIYRAGYEQAQNDS